MGNSPSTDPGRAELRDQDIEAMDTKGEKSSEVTNLADKNSKSKDDESLIQKPLHIGQTNIRISGTSSRWTV